MDEEKNRNFKINQGKRKINPLGNIMEEEWITIEGPDSKEVIKEIDKRWGNK